MAVASAMFGKRLAWITADPLLPTMVVGRLVWLELAWNVTVAGTVATPVLLELTLTVSPPAGAGPFRNMNSCVAGGLAWT